MLERVCSGFQTGADIAGVDAAKECGIKTGGWIPNGFITQDGPKPEYAELYGAQEHKSNKYPPRTYQNVKDSDGTIRFAIDFESAGEICTLKAIKQYDKPHLDVRMTRTESCQITEESVTKVVNWIKENKIRVLNIAGNSNRTYPLMYKKVKLFLKEVFTRLLEG